MIGRSPRIALGATAVVVGLIALARFLPVVELLRSLDLWLRGVGPAGILIYTAVYAAANVLRMPGSWLGAGAGLVFGLVWGTVAVSLGSTAGAALAFLLARRLGRARLERWLRKSPNVGEIDAAIQQEGWKIVLLMRLSPLVPFNLSNYVFGLTGIRFRPYVLASWSGMLPGTVLYVYLGVVGRMGLQATSGAGPNRDPMEYALLVLGLMATIAVSIYLAYLAKRALNKRMPGASQSHSHRSGLTDTSNDHDDPSGVPLLGNKKYDAPSVFAPENLLREARRQKSLPVLAVPAVCVLDPDGDIVRFLKRSGRATQHPGWACYHTELCIFEQDGATLGVVGCAVGGPFAVLVAEQLFASGCELLISVTSAGQIVPVRQPPYYVLIDRALRDEGTSYHYLAPEPYAHLSTAFGELADSVVQESPVVLLRGACWTTDAPFRETEAAIDRCRQEGILAVEMEAASLYAFAHARNRPVICFAHITNQMASLEGDFEKGEADGAVDSLRLISLVARRWQAHCSTDHPPMEQAHTEGVSS